MPGTKPDPETEVKAPLAQFATEPTLSRRRFLQALGITTGAALALDVVGISIAPPAPGGPERKGATVEIPASSKYPSHFGISLAEIQRNFGNLPTMRIHFGPRQVEAKGGIETSGGRFYWETNGLNGDTSQGYYITGDMWNDFQKMGGDPVWGPIMTQQYSQGGVQFQWSQRARFEKRNGELFFGNIFDDLSAAGKDEWLERTKDTPRSFDWSSDAGLPWDTVVERHTALLKDYPALKAAYFSSPLWLQMHGLPMAIKEYGNNVTVRNQRSAIQLWKEDVPWARAGQTTVALGGVIAKEAGLIPKEALELTSLGQGGPVVENPKPEQPPAANLPKLPPGGFGTSQDVEARKRTIIGALGRTPPGPRGARFFGAVGTVTGSRVEGDKLIITIDTQEPNFPHGYTVSPESPLTFTAWRSGNHTLIIKVTDVNIAKQAMDAYFQPGDPVHALNAARPSQGFISNAEIVTWR